MQSPAQTNKIHTEDLLELQETVRYNCDLSDARDNGIYSVCSLILKLRNLYKWENRLDPWVEPDPKVLLDWVADKEDYWETIAHQQFRPLSYDGSCFDPFDAVGINAKLITQGLYYGAGYGRSLKSVFFLSEIEELRYVEGLQVYILEKELNRELASPFAFSHDRTILIRLEPLRFFFWDQIQEIRPSNRQAIYHALDLYGLVTFTGELDRKLLRERFETIVQFEMEAMIHHEVGELQENAIDTALLQVVVAKFPGTVIEYVARAIKDILADTHPKGMLGHIVSRQKATSLCFYTGFLDNLRKLLFPEIEPAGREFIRYGDWQVVANASQQGRQQNQERATLLRSILSASNDYSDEEIKSRIGEEIIRPLGLENK